MMPRKTRLLKSPLKQQRGAVTIEAAIVFPIFILMVFSGIELSRGLLIRASLNNSLAEAARAIKLDSPTGSYQAVLRNMIDKNPSSLIDSALVKVTDSELFYCPAQLATGGNCTTKQRQEIPPIGRFKVNYDFTSFSPILGTLTFNSSIIVKYEQK